MVVHLGGVPMRVGFRGVCGAAPAPPLALAVTVGRCANRIAKGAFEIDGVAYQLARNNAAGHALHGGVKGFDKRVWAARVFVSATGSGVAFTRTSPDGEEGYPGTLEVTATYTLTTSNELRMEFTATTVRWCAKGWSCVRVPVCVVRVRVPVCVRARACVGCGV